MPEQTLLNLCSSEGQRPPRGTVLIRAIEIPTRSVVYVREWELTYAVFFLRTVVTEAPCESQYGGANSIRFFVSHSSGRPDCCLRKKKTLVEVRPAKPSESITSRLFEAEYVAAWYEAVRPSSSSCWGQLNVKANKLWSPQ